MPKSSLGPHFLSRSLRTTGVVLLIFLPFGIYYLGVYPTLAIFSGGVWGLVNIIFLSTVVRSAIRPGGVAGGPLAVALVIKFPLLYLAGYALLQVPQFSPLNLLIGFSAGLAVIALKAFGRALMHLDNRIDNHQDLPEAT